MATTFAELQRRVTLRIPNSSDGRVLLLAREAVNDAQRVIARVHDFDELMAGATASTTAAKKRYDVDTDLGLTRFKDFHTVRLIDGTNSRMLQWVHPAEMDRADAHPESTTGSRPSHYTQRGNVLELYPIPDDVYTLSFYFSQWPAVLSDDSDTMSFSDDLVDVITVLAVEMVEAALQRRPEEVRRVVDWGQRARALLTGAVTENVVRPDRTYVARPFDPCGGASTQAGEYWRNPFIRGVR